jgi:hypothetical protein
MSLASALALLPAKPLMGFSDHLWQCPVCRFRHFTVNGAALADCPTCTEQVRIKLETRTERLARLRAAVDHRRLIPDLAR